MCKDIYREKYLEYLYDEVTRATEEFIERQKTNPVDLFLPATKAEHFEEMFSTCNNNQKEKNMEYRIKKFKNDNKYIVEIKSNDIWTNLSTFDHDCQPSYNSFEQAKLAVLNFKEKCSYEIVEKGEIWK